MTRPVSKPAADSQATTLSSSVSVQDLPNELLLLIFKLLHKPSRKNRVGQLSPSMFPFAQAKVCERWRAVLANSSIFWTYIPIAVDRDFTPALTIDDYFCWSREQPVQVFVGRHAGTYKQDDPDEKARVAAVMPHISQHLHRISILDFALIRRSSFPDLHSWLSGEADILERMEVHCRIEGENKASVITPYEDEPDLYFSFPRLQSLSLDGRNFNRACIFRSDWLEHAPKLRTITLTSFQPSSPSEELSVRDTLRALSKAKGLARLNVHGVSFLDSNPRRLLPSLPGCSLELHDLRGNATASFLQAVEGQYIESLVLRRCSLLGVTSFFACGLLLEDISEEWDLDRPFRDITTAELVVVDCPGFNDSVLDLLADAGLTNDAFMSKSLWIVYITGCTNFSVRSLYRMVHARRLAAEQNPGWDGTEYSLFLMGESDGMTAISVLTVENGPPISDSYRRRFEQLVASFHWTVAGESESS
ncbi:hypothetical protein HYDPIDRAFT_168323 [Hydnomerulius pinastri MD-312]|uniref:Unplaced genomic scaffold scaffold_16, whole genome shotgun sequence n=1 Tax=Hydnomerulius pinastri MD-312 TaxID=994086 RepID=A0A0C9VD05_9AGAM|nr:hypothetical protein HYDPIDRAFT_168323 [Hydnomerulius pinastri MD-312]